MLFLGSVTLTGFDEAAGAVIKDATGLGIENAFERLRAEAAAQFATQGSAFGSPWPPRNPDRSPGRPLLVLTGRLRGSWTDQENPEHVEEILAGPGSEVIGLFGTAVPYAGFHEFGTRRLPAKPVLTPQLLQGAL